MTTNRWGWAAGGLAWALGVLATARPPSDGAGWRFAFVAVALAGSWWAWRAVASWRPSTWAVLGLAVVLRAVVFPLGPSLSDDGYRYVWDGVVQVEDGVSPYRHRPSDPALAHRHAEDVFERMNSPDYYSVYPPVSQGVFALGGAAYGAGWRASWWIIKGLTVAAELVGVVLLLRTVGAPAVALYAWHPLSVIEVAGQGHTEGLLVGALGVLVWAVGRRPALAGAAVAVAGWVKLYPFALVPFVARRGGWRTLTALLVAATALAAPYADWGSVLRVAESLRLYSGTFDFYSAPYLALKDALYHRVADPGRAAAAALAVGWGALVVALLATHDPSRRRTLWSTAAVVVGVTLASSTLHPWHFLGALAVLPLLQFKQPVYWLLSCSLITYGTYVWAPGHSVALWAGWGGAAVIAAPLALGPLMRARARGKWRRVRPFVPALRPGARVLDLGAGEGYVGDAVAETLGVGVTAVDVVRYGGGRRRVDLYDGRTLPYETGTFGLTLVAFVLHHADDPVAILREAVRVTNGPVLILETVWRAGWQKGWLQGTDRLLNRLRSGAAMGEETLDIRSDPEWRRLFERERLTLLRAETFSGLHPQALYAIEGHGAAAASTSSTDAVRASSQTASS